MSISRGSSSIPFAWTTALIVSASCGFPRPADVGDDDIPPVDASTSDAGDRGDASSSDDASGPPRAVCQLTALSPSIANSNDIVMLEGTFADPVTVNFPGAASVAATVLGPHRARVTVPMTATEGTLTITSCGATVGALTFRRASFALGMGAFSANLDQTAGAQQSVALAGPRDGHASVVIRDRLYVLGGTGSTGPLISIEQATINANGSLGPFARVSSVSLVTARRAHTSAIIGNTLYVIGGLGNSPLNSIERADIHADGSLGAFSTLVNVTLATARSGHASVVIGNYLYVFGGSGNTALDSVERSTINIDGSLAAFTIVPGVTLTMARSSHTASVTGNYVYVIGGTRGNNTLQDVERAAINPDGSLGSFAPVTGAALTTARTGHTTELVGSYLYVVGGASGSGPLSSVERAPLSDTGAVGSFVIVTDAVLTTGRRGHTSNVIGNHLWTLGGSAGGLLSGVERAPLDVSGSVSPFATVPQVAMVTARSSFSTALLGRNLYLIAGFDGPTERRSDVERASFAEDGSLSTFATLPGVSLTAIRGGHSDAVIGNYLYILPGFGLHSFERAIINDDGSLGAFATIPDAALVTPRYGFSVIAIDNYLYIIGGFDDSFGPLNSIERAPLNADRSLGTFEQVSAVALSVERGLHTSLRIGSFFYVIGGSNARLFNDTPPLNSVESATINADGSLGSFGPVAGVTLTAGRVGHATAVVGPYLYVLGGRGVAGILNSIERAAISPDGRLGSFAVVAGVTLATERMGAATAVVGNYLYVIGGSNGSTLTSIERATLDADGSLGRFETLSNQSRTRASR